MKEGRALDGKFAGVATKKVIFLQRQERLQKLCESTGYQIIQRNGQRIYQLIPGLENLLPEKGSEVFIAKLPKDVLEDEIVPLFASIGPIYNVRLMLDYSGYSRGYCFVSYYYRRHAYEAVSKLNNVRIGKSRNKILVSKSLDNRRLFIGHIPVDKTKEEIFEVLQDFIEGIVDIILYPSREQQGKNRGYAFIEFGSHQQAAVARRLLSPGVLTVWGIPLVADWADPIPEVNPELMPQIKKLFIRNIDMKMTHQQVLEWIRKYIPAEHLLRLYTKYDYGFIHFPSRKIAEDALQILQGKRFGTKEVVVEWARPPIYSKANRITRPPSHLCTAVPPILRRQVNALKELRNRSKKMFQTPQASAPQRMEFGIWNNNEVNELTYPI